MRRTAGGAGGILCEDPLAATGFSATLGREEEVLLPPATPASQRSRPDSGADNSFPRSTVGVHTLTNHGKGGENQDSYLATSSPGGTRNLVGVFDGHGEHGRRVSQFARTHLAKSFFGHKDVHSDPVSAFESAFSDTQRQIERQGTFDALHSGTTAVTAYRHRDRLFVANVGDSRAVLGCCEGTPAGNEDRGSPSGSGTLRAVDLSSDQRPGREDEKRRIQEQGGSVHQSTIQMRTSFGGPPRLIRVGPERVWDRTGMCGLGVARSLGDMGMRPYVTAQPEISDRQLGPRDRLLILGSDGVWDRLDSQEAVDIAARHRDPSAAAREITGVARQRWHSETQGQMSDDITAVVVHLDYGSAPARSSSTPLPRARPGAETLPSRLSASQRLAALESLRPAGLPRARRGTSGRPK